VQLTEWEDAFRELGVGIAGMTYDATELQAAFHREQGLGYPLLHDEDARHVNAWGIRNEQYGPEHTAYGVPHPGIVFLDPDGVIRAKFALPGYRRRPPYEEVLARVRALLGEGRNGAAPPAP
jgi:peroxiredoxin